MYFTVNQRHINCHCVIAGHIFTITGSVTFGESHTARRDLIQPIDDDNDDNWVIPQQAMDD